LKVRLLNQKEIGPFLKFLFGDVGIRAKPLILDETAAVVRYLQLLSCYAVPKALISPGEKAIKEYGGRERREEERAKRKGAADFAATIWRELLSAGEIVPQVTQKHRSSLQSTPKPIFVTILISTLLES
jgi:hypothetical protein